MVLNLALKKSKQKYGKHNYQGRSTAGRAKLLLDVSYHKQTNT